jgi:hypothetical protein
MTTVFRILLGLHQVVGGAIGLWLVALALSHGSIQDVRSFIIFLCIVAVFSLSLAAGVGLLMRKPWAVAASSVCQLLQLIGIKTAGLTAVIAAGGSAWLALFGSQGSLLTISAISRFEMSLTTGWGGAPNDANTTAVWINLAAAAALGVLVILASADQRRAAGATPGSS